MEIMCLLVEAGQALWICKKKDDQLEALVANFDASGVGFWQDREGCQYTRETASCKPNPYRSANGHSYLYENYIDIRNLRCSHISTAEVLVLWLVFGRLTW